jgi:multiple sugar transport system substrate-binding protein
MMLLLTAGCNSRQNENGPANDTLPAGKAAEGEKRILTIAVYDDWYHLDTIIDRFTAIHPDVTVELTDYKGDEEKYKLQVTTQLLAGKAPDIMDAFLSEEQYFDRGLLADILPLMQNDPAFNEDDYYMNIIKSTAYKGKLITFPITFYYRMIGVNNTFSQELVERYSGYETISFRQLFDIYNNLEDTGGRYLCWNIDPLTAVAENLNTFIDYENKKCYFDTPGFIEFINDAKNCTSPQKLTAGELGWVSGGKIDRADREHHATQFLFENVQSNMISVLDTEIFTHYIPLVNDKNELILMIGRRHCINGLSKNKELAWEFIKFLTTPQANEDFIQLSYSVNKEQFRTAIPPNIAFDVDEWRRKLGYDIDGETDEIVEQVMAKLEVYNEMPGEYPLYLCYDYMKEALTFFFKGSMTAEQVAEQLQRRVSLILSEQE